MSYETLFGAISIIVEEFRASFDVFSSYQDEPGSVPERHHFGLKVGLKAGVVDEPAQTARFAGSVNAVKETLSKLHKNSDFKFLLTSIVYSYA